MQLNSPFKIVILPRKSMTWEEFLKVAPPNSIALDGVVRGGPNFEPATNHVNYDHHDCVKREATMSTATQVYVALKGGLMKAFAGRFGPIHIYINDTDQDTSLAVWFLLNHKKFEGTASMGHINRLRALTDVWDITAGAFPMSLDEQIIRQHNWVFRPYTDLRKSGALAIANEAVLSDNLTAVMNRLNQFMMGQSGEEDLDTRHEILYESPDFKIVDEIGGNEARYYLWSQGMNAFISLVARRPDGRFVYSIGRRSQYIPFPVETLYDDLNAAEGLDRTNGWNGSTIIGGSSREQGSGLSWEAILNIVNRRLFIAKTAA
jgi:hypothetical protein